MMEFPSLPNEMCASVMKYLPSDEMNKLREISIRMNKIARKYELDRYEVREINISIGLLCEKQSYYLEEKASYEKKLEEAKKEDMKRYWKNVIQLHTIKTPNDGIDYNICSVNVILNKDDDTYETDESGLWRHIYRVFEDESDPYTALDDILRKLKCTSRFSIGYGDLSYELVDCICRNKSLFRKAITIIFTDVTFKCTKTDLGFLKLFKRLECIAFISLEPDCGLIIENVLSNFDCGLVVGQKEGTTRKPHNFGDKKLLQWIERIPAACGLEGYQNNFSQPLFRTFLLMLITSPFTRRTYHFGSLSSKTGGAETMREFLVKHELSFKEKESDGAFKFEIDLPRKNVEIEFEIEKSVLELNLKLN